MAEKYKRAVLDYQNLGGLTAAETTSLNLKSSMLKSGSSHYGSTSHKGSISLLGGGTKCLSIDICPDLLLAGAALAGAAAFYALYAAISAKGRRRRKRNQDGAATASNDFGFSFQNLPSMWDLAYAGLEEFENKVDQIAAGHEENSWISALYKKLSDNFSGSSDELQNGDLDGMEPPILDETWGLEDIQRIYQENNTVPEFGSDNNVESVNIMTKGDPGTDETETTNDDDLKGLFGEQKCNTKFWRCIGGVVQGGAHYLQEPGGLTNAIQKTLFKVAFHGGFGNVWNALMTIPEARKVKKCMNEKDECLSVEILKREVNATLDDSPRMIINPEFVEGLDNSDGQDQFDPEDQKKYDEAINDEENEIES